VLLTYLGVAVLHALWDSASDVAAVLALIANGRAVAELATAGGLTAQTASAVAVLASILYVVVLIVVAAGGILTLWLVLRHYHRAERRRLAAQPIV
jgi:hypothetical protein